MRMFTSETVRTAALLLALSASGALAQEKETILIVQGDFDGDGVADERRFSRDELAALGEESFSTSTIWTEGAQEFVGVRLHRLLEALAPDHEGQVDLVAVNDYQVSMPSAEAEPNGALLAYLRNGEQMTLRDKGPVWLVYPYDASDLYRTEVVYSRSVWQLSKITLSN